MINSIFSYLVESTICMIVFMIVYRYLIAHQTHFLWMRKYLLSSSILSVILPILIIPIQWNSSQTPLTFWNFDTLAIKANSSAIVDANQLQESGIELKLLVIYSLIGIYLIGVLYKTFIFIWNLKRIFRCIKANVKTQEGRYWVINLNDEMPPFSFFNYIFLGSHLKYLSESDLYQIKEHEKLHARQYHSIDLLFTEFISIFFWFNPLIIYFKKSIQDLHEYIVDERMTLHGARKKEYAKLLLNLASGVKGFNLSAGFSDYQIKRRIQMISKPRTAAFQKLACIIIIPISIFLLLAFSLLDNPYSESNFKMKAESKTSTVTIGDIIWKGNLVYSNEILNKAFGLKKGDPYNKDEINKLLENWNSDLPSLYLDNGYINYKADLSEKRTNGVVNLIISIHEGQQAIIGEIIIKGNIIIPTEEIRNKIDFKSGDLFSRTKITNSVSAIFQQFNHLTTKASISKIDKTTPYKSTDQFAVIDMLFEVSETQNK